MKLYTRRGRAGQKNAMALKKWYLKGALCVNERRYRFARKPPAAIYPSKVKALCYIRLLLKASKVIFAIYSQQIRSSPCEHNYQKPLINRLNIKINRKNTREMNIIIIERAFVNK